MRVSVVDRSTQVPSNCLTISAPVLEKLHNQLRKSNNVDWKIARHWLPTNIQNHRDAFYIMCSLPNIKFRKGIGFNYDVNRPDFDPNNMVLVTLSEYEARRTYAQSDSRYTHENGSRASGRQQQQDEGEASEEDDECPLCAEPMDVTDQRCFPCMCGYQVCLFCLDRIMQSDKNQCPACRTPYVRESFRYGSRKEILREQTPPRKPAPKPAPKAAPASVPQPQPPTVNPQVKRMAAASTPAVQSKVKPVVKPPHQVNMTALSNGPAQQQQNNVITPKAKASQANGPYTYVRNGMRVVNKYEMKLQPGEIAISSQYMQSFLRELKQASVSGVGLTFSQLKDKNCLPPQILGSARYDTQTIVSNLPCVLTDKNFHFTYDSTQPPFPNNMAVMILWAAFPKNANAHTAPVKDVTQTSRNVTAAATPSTVSSGVTSPCKYAEDGFKIVERKVKMGPGQVAVPHHFISLLYAALVKSPRGMSLQEMRIKELLPKQFFVQAKYDVLAILAKVPYLNVDVKQRIISLTTDSERLKMYAPTDSWVLTWNAFAKDQKVKEKALKDERKASQVKQDKFQSQQQQEQKSAVQSNKPAQVESKHVPPGRTLRGGKPFVTVIDSIVKIRALLGEDTFDDTKEVAITFTTLQGKLAAVKVMSHSLLCIFDCIAVKPEVVSLGLKRLFANPEVTKYVHNCASYLSLLSQFGVITSYQNIVDIQLVIELCQPGYVWSGIDTIRTFFGLAVDEARMQQYHQAKALSLSTGDPALTRITYDVESLWDVKDRVRARINGSDVFAQQVSDVTNRRVEHASDVQGMRYCQFDTTRNYVLTSRELLASEVYKATGAAHEQLTFNTDLEILKRFLPSSWMGFPPEQKDNRSTSVAFIKGAPLLVRRVKGDMAQSVLPPKQMEVSIGQIGDKLGGVKRLNSQLRWRVDECLHKFIADVNMQGDITGVTMKLTQVVTGAYQLIQDLLFSANQRPNVLFLKTTRDPDLVHSLLRESADLIERLHPERRESVVVVDTFNDIGGDGDAPHPGLGFAHRVMVDNPLNQASVIVRAHACHRPGTLVVSQLLSAADLRAMKMCQVQRTRLLAATNGTFADLVRLGDPDFVELVMSTFQVVVEVHSADFFSVISDLPTALASLRDSGYYGVQQRKLVNGLIALNHRQIFVKPTAK